MKYAVVLFALALQFHLGTNERPLLNAKEYQMPADDSAPCSEYFLASASCNFLWGEGRISFYVRVEENVVAGMHFLPSRLEVRINDARETPTAEVLPNGKIVLRISSGDYERAASCLPPPT